MRKVDPSGRLPIAVDELNSDDSSSNVESGSMKVKNMLGTPIMDEEIDARYERQYYEAYGRKPTKVEIWANRKIERAVDKTYGTITRPYYYQGVEERSLREEQALRKASKLTTVATVETIGAIGSVTPHSGAGISKATEILEETGHLQETKPKAQTVHKVIEFFDKVKDIFLNLMKN